MFIFCCDCLIYIFMLFEWCISCLWYIFCSSVLVSMTSNNTSIYKFGLESGDCIKLVNCSILLSTIAVPMLLLVVSLKTKNDLMYDNLLPAIMTTIFAVIPTYKLWKFQTCLCPSEGFVYAVCVSVVMGACGTIFSKHCCMNGDSNPIASLATLRRWYQPSFWKQKWRRRDFERC